MTPQLAEALVVPAGPQPAAGSELPPRAQTWIAVRELGLALYIIKVKIAKELRYGYYNIGTPVNLPYYTHVRVT